MFHEGYYHYPICQRHTSQLISFQKCGIKTINQSLMNFRIADITDKEWIKIVK